MKKVITFLLLVLSGFLLSNTEVTYGQNMTFVLENYFDKVLTQKVEWEDSDIGEIIELNHLNGTSLGYLLRVYKGDESNGYIVYLHEQGIVEMSFSGNDEYDFQSGEIYYVLPGLFLNKESLESMLDYSGIGYGSTRGINYKNYSSNYNEQEQKIYHQYDELFFDYNLTSSNIINLSSNVSTVYSPGYVSEVISNVPDYLNEVVFLGCVPTATSMMIAYYDNEYNDTLTDIDSSTSFPSSANSYTYDTTGIGAKNLISKLGDDLMTNKDSRMGTDIMRWSHGMETFLLDYNSDSNNVIKLRHLLSPIYDDDPSTPNELAEYYDLIDKGNPVVLFLDDYYYDVKHAVIGVGYFEAYGPFTIPGPNGELEGVIIHNDISHGEKWIAYTAIEYIGYIIIDDSFIESIVENGTYTTHSFVKIIRDDDGGIL